MCPSQKRNQLLLYEMRLYTMEGTTTKWSSHYESALASRGLAFSDIKAGCKDKAPSLASVQSASNSSVSSWQSSSNPSSTSWHSSSNPSTSSWTSSWRSQGQLSWSSSSPPSSNLHENKDQGQIRPIDISRPKAMAADIATSNEECLKPARQRHFVQHNYHDHSQDFEEDSVDIGMGMKRMSSNCCGHDDATTSSATQKRKGGLNKSFPQKLHKMLEEVERDGHSSIVSWQPHGRCFIVHDQKQFTEKIMPKYFKQSKFASFQRQLHLYGFLRLTRGRDTGGYYNELFLRGMTFLCRRMLRTRIKGTGFKASSSPETEPNFYEMPPVSGGPASVGFKQSTGKALHDASLLNGSHKSSVKEAHTVDNLPLMHSYDPLVPFSTSVTTQEALNGISSNLAASEGTKSALPYLDLFEPKPLDTCIAQACEDGVANCGWLEPIDASAISCSSVQDGDIENDSALCALLDMLCEQ